MIVTSKHIGCTNKQDDFWDSTVCVSVVVCGCCNWWQSQKVYATDQYAQTDAWLPLSRQSVLLLVIDSSKQIDYFNKRDNFREYGVCLWLYMTAVSGVRDKSVCNRPAWRTHVVTASQPPVRAAMFTVLSKRIACLNKFYNSWDSSVCLWLYVAYVTDDRAQISPW